MAETQETDFKTALEIRRLNFFYGKFQGLKDINLRTSLIRSRI